MTWWLYNFSFVSEYHAKHSCVFEHQSISMVIISGQIISYNFGSKNRHCNWDVNIWCVCNIRLAVVQSLHGKMRNIVILYFFIYYNIKKDKYWNCILNWRWFKSCHFIYITYQGLMKQYNKKFPPYDLVLNRPLTGAISLALHCCSRLKYCLDFL